MSYVIDLIIFALVILIAVGVGYNFSLNTVLAPKAAS
jgi:hypothetical protein